MFAETSDGRRLHANGGTIGLVFAGGRSADPALRATGPDVERGIRSMLTDLDRAPPPQLAWYQLAEVLKREGMTTSEQELIALSFVVEFSEALLVALEQ